MSDVTEIQPETIDDIEVETAEQMLARLAGQHGSTLTPTAEPDGRATPAPRPSLAPVPDLPAASPNTGEPAPPPDTPKTAPPPRARGTRRKTTTSTPAPDPDAASTRTRVAVNVPTSIYTATKDAAATAAVNLTEFTLAAINRHATDLSGAFGARVEAVAGPIPVTSRPRQRRDLGEPPIPMQLYVSTEQLEAIDGLVADVNAGSRSALVTEALRREVNR